MNRLLFLTFALCLLSESTIASGSDLPNIVLMMADDMGLGDTSAYQDFTGNDDDQQIHTPQMERLARMGVRFTDAHTPSSRCTTTRYGLLTGRYNWRSRIKHWVLYGVQGDPMIEPDRPTIASLLRDQGYRTGLVGKWHVGLRYRQSDGTAAAGWVDADLKQPLFDTPLDHGFDFCRFTSRSHGTSGATGQNKKKPNNATQSVGPGHIHGRTAVSATDDGKRLVEGTADAYVLNKLGSRHSDHAIGFLNAHLQGGEHETKPFFLYYPSNSNHGPYTPDESIGGVAVAGAAKSVSGNAMNVRSDYVYENDVALGRLLDYLESHDDPRRPGKKLIDNTIVIFTSDNGAEKDLDTATGPFRSNKGSAYEGGHRVPFLVAWPGGSVGDGDDSSEGQSSDALIGLKDMFATFSEIVDQPMPDLLAGEKGGEDSFSVLPAWRGKPFDSKPVFFNDHKQAKDRAVLAFRVDDPVIDGNIKSGKWKLFFDAQLLRSGKPMPRELYNLATDPKESTNLLLEPELRPLVEQLSRRALKHRTAGGHRVVELAGQLRIQFRWIGQPGRGHVGNLYTYGFSKHSIDTPRLQVKLEGETGFTMSMSVRTDQPRDTEPTFTLNDRGMGVSGGRFAQVESGESIEIVFDNDMIVESASIVAGNGACGGFYQVGDKSPLAIYCVDDDTDSEDQTGILSDIGIVRKGEPLRFSSSPHLGVETAGQWRLAELTIRLLKDQKPK